MIELETPRPNEKISSPLILRGNALGSWFFEGDFPVILTDWDGKIIAEGYVSSKGEWMLEGLVPFGGELIFEKPEPASPAGRFDNRGTLILRKDNVSDNPKLDNALEIPILFE